MTKPDVVVIGRYEACDREAMETAWNAQFLTLPQDIDTLPEGLRGSVRAIACTHDFKLTGPMLEKFPALEIVANFGVGYDNIDVPAASARQVTVTNTPGVLDDDVADLAVAMLLAQSRQIAEASNFVRAGAWSRHRFPLNRKVSGGRAGIVGLGRIGREIADRLAAFKMEIHYSSRGPKDTPEGWQFHADPVDLARAVDYLIVAIVGGAETVGHVSREVLAALGPDGIVVNISRGSTIDEEALIEALQTGTIRGAALDVFNNEPNIDPRFLALDNVLLQPHQGSATIETRGAMGQLQRDNIDAFFAGKPLLTPVN